MAGSHELQAVISILGAAMQQTFAASILNKAGRSMSNHVKHAVRLRCYASITQTAIPALSASNAPTASRRVRKRQLNDQEGRVMLKNMPLPELERWCQQQGESSPQQVAIALTATKNMLDRPARSADTAGVGSRPDGEAV